MIFQQNQSVKPDDSPKVVTVLETHCKVCPANMVSNSADTYMCCVLSIDRRSMFSSISIQCCVGQLHSAVLAVDSSTIACIVVAEVAGCYTSLRARIKVHCSA